MSRVAEGMEPAMAARVAPWKGPLVLGAVLILLDQLLQMRATLGLVDWSVPISRFETAVLLTGRLAAFVVAALLTLLAAAASGDRRWIRLHGVAGLAGALILLGCLALLWVDGPVVKSSVPGPQVNAFTAQWIRGLVLSIVGAPALAMFGTKLLLVR